MKRIPIKRILIFLGLNLWEIAKISFIVLVNLYILIFIPLYFLIDRHNHFIPAMIWIAALIFMFNEEIAKWFRDNWRKAGELEKKWSRKS